MAEKLTGRAGATVTQLPTRAARGAGKSRPSTKTVELKSSAPPAPKPRPLSQAERDAQIRAANLDRRRILAADERKLDMRIDVIKEQLKDMLSERRQVRSAIEGTGILLKHYDEAKEDALLTRVDLEEKERLRAEARDIFSVPTGVAKSLFDGIPDAAREQAHWDDMGYRAGLAGGEREPPSTCPPERKPDYRTGYDRAQTEMASAIKRTDGATTGMTLDEAASAGKQAPEDPDASHVSTPADPDKSIDAEANAIVDGVQAQVEREAGDGDDFEASPDELQQQATRRAVQDARETDEALAPHGVDAQRERLNPTAELSEALKTHGTADLASARTAGGIV